MNKLLFNEGGQPVYLDDLKTLQDTSQDQLGLLLSTLGAKSDVFLMNEMKGSLVSVDTSAGKTTFKTDRNWIVKSGIIYEIPQTTLTVSSWDNPLYVGFKTTESDTRNFEDGQEHNCLETLEAYLSINKSNDSMLNVWNLKTIWALMAPLIKANTSVESYKNISVQFINGYSGTVQYKDVGDAYRVCINISSQNTKWEKVIDEKIYTGLFSFGNSSFPYSYRTFYADVVLGSGGDTEARAGHASLINREGSVELSGLRTDMDICRPIDCPIKAIFELPK